MKYRYLNPFNTFLHGLEFRILERGPTHSRVVCDRLPVGSFLSPAYVGVYRALLNDFLVPVSEASEDVLEDLTRRWTRP